MSTFGPSSVQDVVRLMIALGFALWIASHLESPEPRRKRSADDVSSKGLAGVLGLLLFGLALWTMGGVMALTALLSNQI